MITLLILASTALLAAGFLINAEKMRGSAGGCWMGSNTLLLVVAVHKDAPMEIVTINFGLLALTAVWWAGASTEEARQR